METRVLARLLTASTWEQFGQIAQLFVHQHLGLTSASVDGWRDGGSDLRVYRRPGENRNIAVQLTQQRRGWQGKATGDAVKAKGQLGAREYYFLRSVRVPPTERVAWQQEMLRTHQIRADAFGPEEIAAALAGPVHQPAALRILGMAGRTATEIRLTPRDRALYALTYFSPDAHEFRRATTDQVLLALLAAAEGGLPREQLLSATGRLLAHGAHSETEIAARLDGLHQKGDVRKDPSSAILYLSPPAREAQLDLQRAWTTEWTRYVGAIANCLRSAGAPVAGDETSTAVAQLVADVLLDWRLKSVEKLADSECIQQLRRSQVGTAQNLLQALETAGVPPDRSEQLAQSLFEQAAEHPVASHTAGAALYYALRSTATEAVSMVLSGHASGHVSALLDASVTIPWVASKLFAPGRDYLSGMSYAAVEALRSAGVALLVPGPWLEESGVHWLNAWSYIGFSEASDGLDQSTNGFVSHYWNLPPDVRPPSLLEYLSVFGERPEDFERGRSLAIGHIRNCLQNYDVQSIYTPRVEPGSQRDLEMALTFQLGSQGKNKPDILLRHDISALVYVRQRVREGADGHLLVTWDSALVAVGAERPDTGWIVAPPGVVALFANADDVALPVAGLARQLVGSHASTIGVRFLDAVLRKARGVALDAAHVTEIRRAKRELESMSGLSGTRIQDRFEALVARFSPE